MALRITPEARAFAMEQAGRRCECTGDKCRHHLSGARCKRGLRGDQWKVYWRTEGGGLTRDNIEAWCLECFGNNFEVPQETVALLAADILGYADLLREDRRRAITLRSVLRDAADRAACEHQGRLVLDRYDDDVLAEFATSSDAVAAARSVRSGFQVLTSRLDLPPVELCAAIHCGEVTRWRNGLLAGDTVEMTATVRHFAAGGQIVLTASAVAPLGGSDELEKIADGDAEDVPPVGGIWALRF